jgi:hypothetical protein
MLILCVKKLCHFLLATRIIKASVCIYWENPQSNMRLTSAKPKLKIGIPRPKQYAVRDVVSPWQGGTCTVRKVMHVGRLCFAREDENCAFDMGLQSSYHVIWDMRKIGKRKLTERGFQFFTKQLNHWRFRSIHTSEFHRHYLFEVWLTSWGIN